MGLPGDRFMQLQRIAPECFVAERFIAKRLAAVGEHRLRVLEKWIRLHPRRHRHVVAHDEGTARVGPTISIVAAADDEQRRRYGDRPSRAFDHASPPPTFWRRGVTEALPGSPQ